VESHEGFNDGLLAGEVLAARLTVQAWTPPFGRAVVTDGGTLASHASLVAREHGIPPAVGGAGDATRRPR
jgi:pyruvate,water dikinase